MVEYQGNVKYEEMEFMAPPMPNYDTNAPKNLAEIRLASPSLKAAFDAYSDECAGGDRYDNNCAHFLSDAFIRAGFTELFQPNPHINARCNTPAKRPIRARDMWSWFQSKAVRTSRIPQQNTGMWAVFQLKESVYWGGHVAILDSDQWLYAGTGWYSDWDQYLYQW